MGIAIFKAQYCHKHLNFIYGFSIYNIQYEVIHKALCGLHAMHEINLMMKHIDKSLCWIITLLNSC